MKAALKMPRVARLPGGIVAWLAIVAALVYLTACAGAMPAPRDVRDGLAYAEALHRTLTSTVDRLSETNRIAPQKAVDAFKVLEEQHAALGLAKALVTAEVPDLSTAQAQITAARDALTKLQKELARYEPKNL